MCSDKILAMGCMRTCQDSLHLPTPTKSKYFLHLYSPSLLICCNDGMLFTRTDLDDAVVRPPVRVCKLMSIHDTKVCLCKGTGARCSAVLERSLMVRWVVGSILMDTLCYILFQPVLWYVLSLAANRNG